MPSDLYLCVDCGGSKTAVVITNNAGEIVSRALGGPSNFAYLGLTNFIKTVKTTVEDALSTYLANSTPGTATLSLPTAEPFFGAAWLGISGVDSPANIAELTPVLSELLLIPPGERLSICNDTYLLAAPLRFHTDVQYAVTAIGGTGSCFVSFERVGTGGEDGESVVKELARGGGWGWILGDEGGGYDVGREALRHILRQNDVASLGGPPTYQGPGVGSLVRRVFGLFNVQSAPDLLTLVHDLDPMPTPVAVSVGTITADPTPDPTPVPAHRLIPREKRISQLAPLVFTAAFEDKDPLAMEVLRTTSNSLAAQIIMLLRAETEKDGLTSPRAVKASESILCFGGSLVGVEGYRQLVLDTLAKQGYIFKHVEFVADAAAAGAASLASQFGLGKA